LEGYITTNFVLHADKTRDIEGVSHIEEAIGIVKGLALIEDSTITESVYTWSLLSSHDTFILILLYLMIFFYLLCSLFGMLKKLKHGLNIVLVL